MLILLKNKCRIRDLFLVTHASGDAYASLFSISGPFSGAIQARGKIGGVSAFCFKLIVLTSMLLATATAGAQALTTSWERVGEFPWVRDFLGGFAPLAFGSDGRPYIAYADPGNGGKATVKRLNSAGSVWEEVGNPGFSEGSAASISLAFDPDGKPHVAFISGDLKVQSVMRLNDTGTWEAAGAPADLPYTVLRSSLAFGPDGLPYVAFDSLLSGEGVIRLSSAGTDWEQVGPSSIFGGDYDHIKPTFGPDGRLYISYRDESSNNSASVMRLSADSTAWEVVGAPGFGSHWMTPISLAFGPDGRPHVAYVEGGAETKLNVKRLSDDGTAWEEVGSPESFPGNVAYTSLTFGSDGTAYLALAAGTASGQGYNISVMRLNSTGGVWEQMGIPVFTPGAVGYLSLVLGLDQSLYVVYSAGELDVSPTQGVVDPVTTVMRWREAAPIPQPHSVPTLGQWSMLLMSALAALFGVVFMRRRVAV